MLGILNSTLPAIHSEHKKSLMRLCRAPRLKWRLSKRDEICFVDSFWYISNKMQRYTLYLFLKNCSTCFGWYLHPSSGAHNCIYSIWYLSNRYCYLPLLWKSWNWFECGVRIVLICFCAAATAPKHESKQRHCGK